VDLAERAVRGPAATVTRRRAAAEHLAVLLLGLLVGVVHDTPYLLRAPFWTDEAWVAVTTRFPLSALPATTSATPIGFSAVLRLVTLGGHQTGRLLPLAFAGAAVVIAYWLARRLPWSWAPASVIAGLLAGLAVLLVPAMLVRDDLKQYTADACLSLLALALTARLESDWSRWRLAALSASIWGGMLFSDAVAFTGAAILGALCLVQLIRRAWGRLAEAVIAAAVTGVLMIAVFAAFDARADGPGITAYWKGFYVPVHGGLHASLSFIAGQFEDTRAFFGLGPAWLAIPLVIAGLVTLCWLGRWVTAVAAVALLPEMIALSALRRYPLLDLRTSTFLIAITVVVAAIGVAGLAAAARRGLSQARAGTGPSTGRAIAGAAVAAALALAAAGGFLAGAVPYARGHPIPAEDVRDQAHYVFRHAAPGDVIVVNLDSTWGFGYYWPVGTPARRPDKAVLQGYVTYFPGQPRIIQAQNRDQAGVSATLAQALTRSRQHGCSRIWLVRTHLNAAERAAWKTALHHDGVASVPAGGAGLRVIQPSGAACR
jgi:hypothetical protein